MIAMPPCEHRARLKVNDEVFVKYRGNPHVYPAKVIVLAPHQFTLWVYWDRGNGTAALCHNIAHASKRIGQRNESYWDFTPAMSEPAEKPAAVIEQRAQVEQTQAAADTKRVDQREEAKRLHREQSMKRHAKNMKREGLPEFQEPKSSAPNVEPSPASTMPEPPE